MSPQQLHDTWLILTVIATLEISAVAIYLWRMFRFSTRRKFFWMIAAVFAAIAVDQVTQQVKNLGALPPPDTNTATIWMAGKLTVVIVAGVGLGYMVFGRNGKQPPVVPPLAASLLDENNAPTEN